MKYPAFALVIFALAAAPAFGQGRGGGLTSLKQVRPPQPPNLSQYVKDTPSLVALGKAFFWDVQAGSDGKTACATCHFHAGADHRLQNMLAAPFTAGGSVRSNLTLASTDFPFHQLVRQVMGSAGVPHRASTGWTDGTAAEDGIDIAGDGPGLRQVTARNASTVINAVFNVRNFWDGRASRVFTGATPFGSSDKGLNAVAFRNGSVTKETVALDNSSLASQAVGPALNSAEMSYDGRAWPLLARKLLAQPPLARQFVAADDSVLGPMANPDGNGLKLEYSYPALIQSAFQPEYWSAPGVLDSQLTQLESNFSLFWGISIQAYEATLISDDARVDQFLEGNRQALSTLEQQGMQVFQRGNSQCTQCHQGAEFTAAAYSTAGNARVNNNDPDNIGFFRTGVSPIGDDIGLGGNDGFGLALFLGQRGSASGTFKSPGLRNVEFTGPYFHDGGQATLEQVAQFYARNGDFRTGGNLGPGIGQINLSTTDQIALVSFLKALTDDRVRFEKAPFDHPSICVANGAMETSLGVLAIDISDARFTDSAVDKWALIPAVGKGGNKVPLQTFEELLNGIGKDGSRAHNLVDSCSP